MSQWQELEHKYFMSTIETLFAYEQYGVEPDIMTLAMGLASGIPIGVILAKDRASVFTPGEHGSTFGGLLVNRVKPNALRFMPPLIIGNDEVDEALSILGQALSSIGS